LPATTDRDELHSESHRDLPAAGPDDANNVGTVLTERELVDAVAQDRAAGRTTVLANGCFDLLHVGHVRYLRGAKAQADRLIVAVNDDESVTRLKGPGRPLIPAGERTEILAALEPVDYVIVFPDSTVDRLLLLLKPDVHCKGPDYTVESVPERAVVQSYGGRTVIVGDEKQHSTRDLVKRIWSSGHLVVWSLMGQLINQMTR
jgi:D-glycero-beta-D-manno-heptose 1-phosphate adenylyltransferase